VGECGAVEFRGDTAQAGVGGEGVEAVGEVGREALDLRVGARDQKVPRGLVREFDPCAPAALVVVELESVEARLGEGDVDEVGVPRGLVPRAIEPAEGLAVDVQAATVVASEGEGIGLVPGGVEECAASEGDVVVVLVGGGAGVVVVAAEGAGVPVIGDVDPGSPVVLSTLLPPGSWAPSAAWTSAPSPEVSPPAMAPGMAALPGVLAPKVGAT